MSFAHQKFSYKSSQHCIPLTEFGAQALTPIEQKIVAHLNACAREHTSCPIWQLELLGAKDVDHLIRVLAAKGIPVRKLDSSQGNVHYELEVD